jgi:mono/diheme cytochrome c family protein
MRTLAFLAAIALAAVCGTMAFVWSGFYDVSATDQHLPPTYWLMEKTMQRSVARRGDHIPVPPLDSPEQARRGFALYRMHCVQCHGAPGTAPEPFALGLTPLPAPLVQTAREWPPSRIFWVVKYGIKMTGMPAWEFRLSDEEIWSVVAALLRLPLLSPEDYRRIPVDRVEIRKDPAVTAEANSERGRIALQQYACIACHEIRGITGPEARVGPPLTGVGSRLMLGGVLPNTPENMVRWIRAPQQHSPLTAMPDLGVTERDAVDIAAYLSTLK